MRNEYLVSEKVSGSSKIIRYAGNDKCDVMGEAEERFAVCKRLGQNPIWLCKQWVGRNKFAAVFSVKVK